MLELMILLSCSSELDHKPEARMRPSVLTNQEIQGTRFDLLPNSRVDWVGSKVSLDHRGGFERIGGFAVVNNEELVGLEAQFEVASLFSDHPKLTKHLLDPDFFDVEAFPTASFVLKNYTSQNNNGEMTGVLTLKGVSKTIAFPAQVALEEGIVSVEAEFTINRKDFNMIYAGRADDLIRDEVLIKILMRYAKK